MSSALEQSITLEEVFAMVVAKRVPLAPELAGYLTLEIAEGAGSAPGEIDPRQVYIGDEGSVALVRVRREGASGDAEGSVRKILQQLLDASGTQTPALSAAAKRAVGPGIPGLVGELEAALIPVNRAAGRRALARLAREVKRVTLGVGRNASIPASERGPRASQPSYGSIGQKELGSDPAVAGTPADAPSVPEREAPPAEPISSPGLPRPPRFDAEEIPTTAKRDIPAEVLAGAIPASPDELPTRDIPKEDRLRARDEVDSLISSFEVSDAKADLAVSRELKAMVGLEPTPPPPADDAGIDALLAMSGSVRPPPRRDPTPAPPPSSRAQAPASAPAVRKPAPSYADDRALPTAPTKHRRPPAGKKRGQLDRVLIVALVVLLGAGAAILWLLKPGFLTGRTPERVEAERAAAEADRARAAAAAAQSAKACKATLTVADVPSQAEVLLRVGQAPVDVEHMPVGTRLEFVATAEGYAPKRTVIPAKAAWDPGPDGKPRFEAAVQLDPWKAKRGESEAAWPPAEPGTDVGGQGAPGTVHVVSTPRGAEVWLLAGMGPEAVIEQLPCKGDVDVLVAGPGVKQRRLRVKEADFTGDANVRKARASLK